ncbi:hypothetical protein LWHH1689_1544 [Limosilactobacillus reuteri]|uniref:Membrane protein 6-pyruvoyl-tetrahydropterin synthase-related domain-containing protein n=1 Tax=Limosilactobacillus reuteri TaxID=1598 RepID=A0A2S1ES67_LIMRT|nr:hypothetical protein [Limosilactobacillus reuteri]AWD62832.1 hypothetical protein LWHH1689_1544 [Limosilactobacillus reuteri]
MHNSVKNKDIPYILSFILISLTIELPFTHTGKLVADIDWLFHASRVEQIYLNLRHGTLIDFIATNTFQHTGSGSFLFYPYFFLYPWALLRFIFNPITSFYIWQALMTYLSLTIAFYCMKAFSKNSLMSFIFAVVYVFNTYRLYLSFSVFGEYIASAFLPLVFYGFYKMFFDQQGNNNSVMLLSIGMTLLIYSHLVSVIITLEVFALVLVIYSFTGNINNVISQWKNILRVSRMLCKKGNFARMNWQF